jgi:putative transposase
VKQALPWLHDEVDLPRTSRQSLEHFAGTPEKPAAGKGQSRARGEAAGTHSGTSDLRVSAIVGTASVSAWHTGQSEKDLSAVEEEEMAGSPTDSDTSAAGPGLGEPRGGERSAMDLKHVSCGRDGWAHPVGVIDRCDRELIGWEFALRGRAKEVERAIEETRIRKFGTLRPMGAASVVRSDNGLIFQSRRFRSACRDNRLKQEFITLYTPEQNGIIERFFRSLKEEYVWQHRFEGFLDAKRVIGKRIE